MAETKLLILADRGGFRQDGMEKHTDLFIIFTVEAEEAEATGGGGRGCFGGLPHGGERAGDTFSSEITGFSLST